MARSNDRPAATREYLPAVGAGKGHHIAFIVIEQRQRGVSDHVHSDGEAEKLRFRPQAAVDLNTFGWTLGVEGSD